MRSTNINEKFVRQSITAVSRGLCVLVSVLACSLDAQAQQPQPPQPLQPLQLLQQQPSVPTPGASTLRPNSNPAMMIPAPASAVSATGLPSLQDDSSGTLRRIEALQRERAEMDIKMGTAGSHGVSGSTPLPGFGPGAALPPMPAIPAIAASAGEAIMPVKPKSVAKQDDIHQYHALNVVVFDGSAAAELEKNSVVRSVQTGEIIDGWRVLRIDTTGILLEKLAPLGGKPSKATRKKVAVNQHTTTLIKLDAMQPHDAGFAAVTPEAHEAPVPAPTPAAPSPSAALPRRTIVDSASVSPVFGH